MEKFPKQELREFSKEQYPEERKQIAKEAKEKRREYFDQQKEIAIKIEQLREKTERQTEDITGLIQETEIIEEEIAERKKSRIAELFSYGHIKKLSQEKEAKILTQEEFETEFKTLSDLLEELRQEASDKTKLKEAKKVIEKFYQGTSEKWEEYQEEEKNRKIEKIVEDYDVFFLHSTTPYGVPGENSLLKPGTDWKTKLEILLALEPTVSVSTFKPGDNRSNMWAHIGVMLKKGCTETAGRQDIGTLAKGLNERIWRGDPKAKKVSEQIKSAIAERPSNDYNEIVVRDPKVAGFYLCFDNTKQDVIDAQQIKKIIEAFALPFYIIKDGSVFATSWSPEVDKQFKAEKESRFTELLEEMKKCGIEKNGRIMVSPEKEQEFKKLSAERESIQNELNEKFFATVEKITPQEILKNDFTVSEQKKREMIENLLIEQPFKPICQEAFYVQGYHEGGQTFVETNGQQNLEKFNGEINDEQVKKIFEAKLPSGDEIKYLITEKNELFQAKEFITDTGGKVKLSFQIKSDDFDHLIGYLPGFPLHDKERKSIQSSQDYLEAMAKTIERLKEEKNDPAVEKKYSHTDEWIERLAFHLYGFGEQAGKIKDTKTQEEAFALANSIFPQKEYQEIIKRRIDENGNFKVVLEDLKSK